MGVNSTQGFKYKLVAFPDYNLANSIILDLFKDEEIKLSNNITGLFDLGVLPSDFTRTITLPGSQKNNNFFEFVYDISVENPYTFATNQKVPCYLDFDGIYLSNGYIQLNKVNVYQNKFIDSYEVTIYGGLSSFGRDLKTYFLSDLTSLNQFNHTASLSNITSSWEGNLFSGSIVYPIADYGQRLRYTPTDTNSGIDSETGAMCVQDFKPAIRVKEVWDAIFTEFGYTYSSDFFNEAWWDDVYMICNKELRYPIFPSASNEVIINGTSSVNLETYGDFTFGPVSGSSAISQSMLPGNTYPLNWYNITRNPSGILSSSLEFNLDMDSNLRGEINLNFVIAPVSGSPISASGYGVPQFDLLVQGYISSAWTTISTIPLDNINNRMVQVNAYNAGLTKTEQFDLVQQWNQVFNTGSIFINGSPKDTQLRFALKVEPLQAGVNYFEMRMNPGDTAKAYLSVTKVNQAGEGLIMDIPSNMPIGSGATINASGQTNGVLLIDFITAIQKKFNLVIYPNKEKLWDFIVEPFNTWYKDGSIKDFNRYINLNDKIEATPANNLAVNKLNFGDTLDTDYISQQFAKEANREYGKSYYVDFENYFSQGEYTVKSSFASSPLIYLDGTGVSGSYTSSACVEYNLQYTGGGPASSSVAFYIDCNSAFQYQWMGDEVVDVTFCADKDSVTIYGFDTTYTIVGPCIPETFADKIYIPTFISSITYQPTTTLPHIYFYNGLLNCQPWYIESQQALAITATEFTSFPYFDNYQGNLPSVNSKSLLFNNENASYGTTPTESLYSEYWSTYVDLLYNPRTRLFDCSAIIPLADYFDLNLNDIVEWRGNYYHLRAINDYNLSNGECKLQLLGPVIRDVIANVLPEFSCDFNFDIGTYTPAESASFIVAQCFGASQLQVSFTSSLSMSIGESFTFPAEYALDDCWYVSSSFSGALDLSDVSISQSFVDCSACSASLHPAPPPPPPVCASTQWKIDNSVSSFGSFYGGLDCDDNNVGGYVDAYNIGFTVCIKDGTLTTTGFPVVTVDAIC
jgi:hypothetical protein